MNHNTIPSETLHEIIAHLETNIQSLTHTLWRVKNYNIICHQGQSPSCSQKEHVKEVMIGTLASSWVDMGLSRKERDALLDILCKTFYIEEVEKGDENEREDGKAYLDGEGASGETHHG